MSDIMPNGTHPDSNWTDEDWSIFRTWLKSVLHTNKVTVTFTKKDGTERVMKCTLKPELLPPVPLTESTEPKKEKKVNDSIMAVYDLEAKGWRSFTVNTVKNITFSI